MDNIQYMIEELWFSNEVGLGDCSVSTVYRYVRQINERLERGKYDWRVKANIKNRSVLVLP